MYGWAKKKISHPVADAKASARTSETNRDMKSSIDIISQNSENTPKIFDQYRWCLIWCIEWRIFCTGEGHSFDCAAGIQSVTEGDCRWLEMILNISGKN